MSLDELWSLHLEVTAELIKTITARKDELEKYLRKLPNRGVRRPNAGKRQNGT